MPQLVKEVIHFICKQRTNVVSVGDLPGTANRLRNVTARWNFRYNVEQSQIKSVVLFCLDVISLS